MKINVLELDIEFVASAMAITNLDPSLLGELTLKVSLVQPIDPRIFITNTEIADQVTFINHVLKGNACKMIITIDPLKNLFS